ncbi:hypothetical protein HYS50_02505 [Candidatus Woesearchaeota archaeon]|nr:hypothetical protein [Candidatus Woesearchaeota archaeon]
MGILQKLRALDIVTKIGSLILFMMLLYIVFLFLLKPVFITSSSDLPHTTVMGDHIMTFINPAQRNLNVAALFLALVAGLASWLLIKGKTVHPAGESVQLVPQPPAINELEIIKKALSPDEKKILEEIQKAGEITQDSLRFRLGWSKAKVSAILLQLDRLNLVQRERQGKTYNVFISKQK